MNSAERVVKNTVIQYVRLFLNVLIGLYSVRIILDALGTTDYGIYGLVSGLVTLMAFISTSLSQTSVRFIGVSLGKNNGQNTKYVFNNCFWLHFFVAIVLLIILQTLGNFLMENYLVIPEERSHAAKVVFQCVIFSLFINIIITPYNALVIAHEKFIFTASISILDSLLKLAIAFIITYTTRDKLILYGILLAGVTIINLVAFVIYCHTKYNRYLYYCKISFKGIKEIMEFAGWTILDILGTTFTRDGYSVILNRYFGPNMNTVFSLSRQIEGQLYTISASVTETFKPQIMKNEGSGERIKMLNLSFTAGKLGFSMMSIISIPLIIMMPEVLDLWLVDVPDGTVLFSRLLIIACMMNQLTQGLVYANQAIGDIKWFSIIVSGWRMIALPISWLVFHYGAEAYIAIIVFVICETSGSFSRVIILSKQTKTKVRDFFTTTFFRIIPPVAVASIYCLFTYQYVNNLISLLIVAGTTSIIFVVLTYFIALTSAERSIIKDIVQKNVFRKKPLEII